MDQAKNTLLLRIYYLQRKIDLQNRRFSEESEKTASEATARVSQNRENYK